MSEPGEYQRTDLGPAYAAFLPPLVRDLLRADAEALAGPRVRQHVGVVLVADLAGFSVVAERLSLRGSRGAEDLKDLLNRWFGQLVELVHAHSGQVVSFPGDAVVALWLNTGSTDEDASRLAAACGLDAVRTFDAARTRAADNLGLRIGIGWGDVEEAHVGGLGGRWHVLIAGEALADAVRSASTAQPGEVVVSREVWDHVRSFASGRVNAANRVQLVESSASTRVRLKVEDQPAAPGDPGDSDTRLRMYVPRSLQARLEAGHTDWLAEFRRVTVMFVGLEPIPLSGADALDRLQRAVTIVQDVVDRFGGSVNQLQVDDKGMVLVCGWGLALHTHGDDPVRAVRAAFDLRRGLTDAALEASVGLSTGDVFTGLRGNRRRCDYAMIGSPVNLAARLMQVAAGDVCCDSSTYEAASRQFEFEPLAAVSLKGFERPVDLYRLVDRQAEESAIVGRRVERALLRERLDALVEHGRESVVVLEGEAGIGKSSLVANAMEQAVSQGVALVQASGDAIEQSTPYSAWRAPFAKLLGARPEGRARDDRVTSMLARHRRLGPFAPLLNSVLGLHLEETDRSRAVTARGRALLTRELLAQMFWESIGERPTLLLLDDTHWFDSASWSLAEHLHRQAGLRAARLMLVIATRPIPSEQEPAELQRLSTTSGSVVVHLGPLDPVDTRRFVCGRLRARAIDPQVERLIWQRAEGHPFFTEELAHTLRDRALVYVDNGVCRFTGAAAAGESLRLPHNVQVTVGARIDQLSLAEQLTIKVASVIGRTFELATLRAVHPTDVEASDLVRRVDALVAHQLLRREPQDGEGTYAFNHAITQEVAYSLLSFGQRKQLHALAAACYERQTGAAGRPRLASLLAYHWSRAEAADKALPYLEQAGEQALGRFANEEAVRFYREALELHERVPPLSRPEDAVALPGRLVQGADVRRIRWQRRLGDGYANMGRWHEARAHFADALQLLGQPLPDSGLQWGLRLSKELLVQLLHRLGARRSADASGQVEMLMRETVCAYERMGAISYFSERPALLFYCLVAALNRAERLEPTGELALTYADVGNIVGVVPVHALARIYNRIACEQAQALGIDAVSAKVLGRSAVYRIGAGDWSACQDLERSMILSDEVGDPYQWEESAAIRVRAAHFLGEFEIAKQLAAELRRRASASGSAAHEIWGIDGEAWADLYCGRDAEAVNLAETGLRLLAAAKIGDRLPTLDFFGSLALGHLHLGDQARARDAAARIMTLVSESPILGHLATLGLSAASETYLSLWEAEGHAAGATADLARRACRHLERYSRINPPARARAWLWRGGIEWMMGRPRRAMQSWKRCLSEAERLGLPYEAARAHFEIGRRLRPAEPERRDHLDRARRGFRTLHAEGDLMRVEACRLD